MRYYVVADVHGYFSELKTALTQNGFFEDDSPHKLIVCGDLYDRGKEAQKLQEFILDLIATDKVILIKGNHEDLALDLLHKWNQRSYLKHIHVANGTLDTILQLTGFKEHDLIADSEKIGHVLSENPYFQTIIPAMCDYYETEHYIFTHGWIPCVIAENYGIKQYSYMKDWRIASKEVWDRARWVNGMEAAHCGVIEKGKTIVCGHWHCSFGHSHYEGDGGEFEDANFSPYYGNGIIALDACTALSRKINCVVIED